MTLDLDAVRRRAEAATPGPWEWDDLDGDPGLVSLSVTDVDLGEFGSVLARWRRFVVMGYPTKNGSGVPALDSPDAEFIAHARTDIPALLDALEAAQAEVARLRAQVAESVPRSALVQVNPYQKAAHARGCWFQKNGRCDCTLKDRMLYVIRTEGGPDA